MFHALDFLVSINSTLPCLSLIRHEAGILEFSSEGHIRFTYVKREGSDLLESRPLDLHHDLLVSN